MSGTCVLSVLAAASSRCAARGLLSCDASTEWIQRPRSVLYPPSSLMTDTACADCAEAHPA